MSGDVIPWPVEAPGSSLNFREKVEGIIAIFHAIDAGELLAALPDCTVARAHHTAALALLAIAEQELFILRDALI